MSDVAQKVTELNQAVARLFGQGSYREALAAANEAVRLAGERLGAEHPKTAVSLYNLGSVKEAMGDLAGARPCYEQVLAVRQRTLGADHPDTAASLDSMASVLKAMGDLDGARSHYEQALAISRKAPGERHPDTAWRLHELGSLLQDLGDRAGARTCYEKAVAINRQALGEDDPRTAACLNSLGTLLLETRDYEEAQSAFEEALAIRRRALGEEHPETALSLRNLGILLQAMGDLAGARPYLEQALAVRRKASGETHPDTARSLDDLGGLLRHIGDLAGARPYLEQALAIRRQRLGEAHPDVAVSLNKLGWLLLDMGDLAAARPCLEQALAIRRRALGEGHAATAESLGNMGVLLHNLGKLAEARPYLEQALAIKRRTLGENHPETATGLNNLGLLLRDLNDLAGARPCLEQALAIRRRVLGEEHPHTAGSFNNLGLLLQGLGDHAGARVCFDRALAIRRKVLGDEHPETAQSLDNLGGLLSAMRDYTAALPYSTQALAIRRRALGEGHPDTAVSHGNMGFLLQAMGDAAGARPHLEQALAIRLKALGEEHPDTVGSMDDLGRLFRSTGDLAGAYPYFDRALAIRSKTLGAEHPATAQSLNNLLLLLPRLGDDAKPGANAPSDARERVRTLRRTSGLSHEKGSYREAIAAATEAVQIARDRLGEDHPDTADGYNNLGVILNTAGDYSGARPYLEQALAIRRRTRGEQHLSTAHSLNNLGSLLHSMGDLPGARAHYEQALAIKRTAVSEDQPDIAKGLHNLASILQEMGDYAGARSYLEQALAIDRKALGDRHPDTATILSGLGILLWEMGDHAGAQPYYEQALAIRREALGEEHPETGASLRNLGSLLCETGQIETAKPYLERALAVLRQTLGEGHPGTALCLNALGSLLRHEGDYAGARAYFEQALAVDQRALGEDHPDIAMVYNNLGGLLQAVGDFAGARPCIERALAIKLAAQGEDHPDTAVCLRNLACLCVAENRLDEAWQAMVRAACSDDRMVGQIFSVGSERHRADFLTTLQGGLEAFLSFVLRYRSDSRPAVQAALDAVLRRKALGAEALAVQRDAVLGGRYPHLQQSLRELSALRAQIARKTLDRVGPEGLAAYTQALGEWQSRRQQLEAELARQIPEMSLAQSLHAADRRAVALGLGEGVALVEFVRFNVFDFHAVTARGERQWQPARYLAFVLPAGHPDDVRLVDLGEAAPIDRLIADFRQGVTADPQEGAGRDLRRRRTGAPSAAGQAGPALRAAVFDPLAPALGGRTRLVLAPDGDLSRLPFEVLPGAGGRPLLEYYRLSYVGCGRDVLRFGRQATRTPAAPVVVCDPDFDLDGTAVAPPSGPGAEPQGQPPARAAAAPGRCSRDFSRGDYHFPRLPGTHEEGARIADLLGVGAVAGRDALEAQLKGCHSPRVLHLATHGFFLADQERNPNGQPDSLATPGGTSGAGRLSGPLPENPLLRSGLALAGANTWLQGGTLPPQAEDGLLTAEDVAGLDLLDTELVVLSACETGLGEIRTGEGVFGLRRSFIVAGARALVMSLWKVPDEQTKELMIDFYRRVLGGAGVADALRGAQLAMREKYPEPYHWGAFICQGDPGPLGARKGAARAPRGSPAASDPAPSTAAGGAAPAGVLPNLSNEETAMSDTLNQVVTHLQFLGYETKPDGEAIIKATHQQKYNINVRKLSGGILLQAGIGGGARAKADRAGFVEAANQCNSKAEASRFYALKADDGEPVLVVEAWHPDHYERAAFGRFLDLWDRDCRLVNTLIAPFFQ